MQVTSAFMENLAEKIQIAMVTSLVRMGFAVLWEKSLLLKDVPLKEQLSKEEKELCPIQSSSVHQIVALKSTPFMVRCVSQQLKDVKHLKPVKKTEHVVFSTIVVWSMQKAVQTVLLVQKMENADSTDAPAYPPNKDALKVVLVQKKDAVGSMAPSA